MIPKRLALALDSTLRQWMRGVERSFHPHFLSTHFMTPSLQLAGVPLPVGAMEDDSSTITSTTPTSDAIWLFAVPKNRITRSKKRSKTTVQKSISKKQNIVVDRITGHLTLTHRLPFRWRDYLLEFDGVDDEEGEEEDEQVDTAAAAAAADSVDPLQLQDGKSGENGDVQEAEFVEKNTDDSNDQPSDSPKKSE